ncbi:hypothetical protein CDL15_Pgr006213 [Punica granatum]|uniref:Uncharacterized protein n=1 Tax=Punica granatum TaxID=22663 RepID=A0A218WZA3_PUNGR|nr:hypothetical protein CDL15_Pgr006213 [Punica granatum]
MKRRLCTGGEPSDRDHLFTGGYEGRGEPFERDGTTRRSRKRKWHVEEVRCIGWLVQGPDVAYGWNPEIEASNGESKPGNGLRRWKACRI